MPRLILGLNDNVKPPTSPLFLDLRFTNKVELQKPNRLTRAELFEDPDKPKYSLLPPGYPTLRVLPQLHERDCGIACLSMFAIAHDYDEVEEIASKTLKRPSPIKGMQNWEMVLVGAQVGMTLKKIRQFALDNEAGILNVRGKKNTPAEHWRHFVVLYQGLVFDTDCCVYRPDDFLSCYPDARFSFLLNVEHIQCL